MTSVDEPRRPDWQGWVVFMALAIVVIFAFYGALVLILEGR